MAISKIGSRAITDGSVLAADFAPGTVTGAKLAGSIANDKLANSAITLGGEAISLGGTDAALNLIDWQSKVTSDGSTVTTMVAGRGYFVDNSSAAGLVKLPASATIGQQVAIKDYAGNFGTNNLTIQRNSHNIAGNATDAVIKTNRASVVLVYVDSTKGWLFDVESNISDLQTSLFTEATGGTVTTTGDFKVHTFTGDGNFVVSQAGNAPVPGAGPSNVDYLVIAGGGGGGSSYGGGGGAGGFRTTFPSPGCNAGAFPVSAQTYPITVGGGGAGGNPNHGSNGANSVFSTITSAGGGFGAAHGPPDENGGPGGSGGGSGGRFGPTTGGSGNTPPVSPSQGSNGGSCPPGTPGSPYKGAGGGGHSAVGENGGDGRPTGEGSDGGAGTANSITGSSVTRAGGGGGGGQHYNPSPDFRSGDGGAGGGGPGGNVLNGGANPGVAGTTNTGGGGGGGVYSSSQSPNQGAGGVGGSGVVIIRYKYQ